MNFENHQLNFMAQKSLCWTMESPATSFQGEEESPPLRVTVALTHSPVLDKISAMFEHSSAHSHKPRSIPDWFGQPWCKLLQAQLDETRKHCRC